MGATLSALAAHAELGDAQCQALSDAEGEAWLAAVEGAMRQRRHPSRAARWRRW